MNEAYDQGRVKMRPESLFSTRISSYGASTTSSVPCSEDLEEIIVVLEEEVAKEELQKNMTFISAYVARHVEGEIKLGDHRLPWLGSMRHMPFEDGEQGLSGNACGLVRSIDAIYIYISNAPHER